MKLNRIGLLFIVIIIGTISGCASYRTSSNINSIPISAIDRTTPIIIVEGDLPDKKYQVIGPIEITVKKLTLFHKNPTKEQANEALIEKARAIGANAIINVTYKNGVGFTTWGYIDASGTGVKIVE